MSAVPETRRSLVKKRRSRFFRRWWVWAVVAVVVLGVLAAAGLLALRALDVKSELESAQALTGTLKTQALELDIAGATKTLDRIEAHTERAVVLADDPLWSVGEALPVLGTNLVAVRQLSAVTNELMADVARPLIEVAGSIDPAALAPVDGAIDLQPLIDAAPAVDQANAGIKKAVSDVDAIDTGAAIEQVAAAKLKIAGLLDELAPALDTLGAVVPTLAPMLGSEGPRSYVLMFMNSAEVRALGGTGLSFTEITTDAGRITIGDAVQAGLGNFPYYTPGVDVPTPDGVFDLYQPGAYGGFIADATMRPNFVSGAEMVRQMWGDATGKAVDGVIAMDPTALGYAMRGMEPVQLSTGDVVTSDNVVSLLLNEVYQRYWSKNITADNGKQDAVFSESVSVISSALVGGQFDSKALIGGLTQAAGERRLLMWSAHEAEQAAFGILGVDGAMPESDENTDRVGVYFHDNVGSKMSYYLATAVSLETGACRDDGRQSYRVSVALTNTLPLDAARSISPSILGTFERSKLKPGVQRTMVYVLAPPGSEIVRATVDGVEVPLEGLHDEAYPAVRLVPVTGLQATSTLTVDIVSADASSKALAAEVTPMIIPTTITEGVLDCMTAG